MKDAALMVAGSCVAKVTCRQIHLIIVYELVSQVICELIHLVFVAMNGRTKFIEHDGFDQ